MGIRRCGWCEGNALYTKYHDHEWGVPTFSDKILFEFLISSLVARALILSFIFEPAAITFCSQLTIYFNTSEKLLTCFPNLCVKSGALKFS